MKDLRGKKVVVVGLGKSGAAAARYAVANGADVTITDLKPAEQLESYKALCRDLPVTYALGGHCAETFLDCDTLILSPGVSQWLPEIVRARERGVALTNEPDLALQVIRTPVIAVTGSAGKTTTCTLIARMLEAARKKVFLGGNIGTPLLTYAMSEQPADFVVAELSSFQLELIAPFVPLAVVYTPIAQDHLDRYDSMDHYVAAKRRLAEFCELRSRVIVDWENPWHRRIAEGTRGRVAWYTNQSQGAGAPEGEAAVYRRDTRSIAIGHQTLDMRRCPAGDKNVQNIMAAALAALAAGGDRDAIQATIDDFRGIAHRLELVRQHRGISFFNDSKATNVISVLNALSQFDDESVVLLAGGKNKAIDFSPLRPSVVRKCKLVVAFGESRDTLADALQGTVPILRSQNFREAVQTAASHAGSGDNVVLSPACASLDMFKNYEERGNTFKSLVAEICGS